MYSLRNKEKTTEIDDKAWIAIKSYINELIDEGYFDSCMEYDRYEYFINNNKLNNKIAQLTGLTPFPLNEKIDEQFIPDLIEGIYEILEIKLNSKENLAKIRYNYTVKINQLFNRFKLNYRLNKGNVTTLHSSLLNNLFIDDLNCQDSEVKNFITLAFEKFRDPNITEQRIGVNKLVDAFERIKTLKDQKKRTGAKKMVESVSDNGLFFNKDIKLANKIANDYFMIRHTEVDKTKIESEEVLEYLFYLYYNCIRVILKSEDF